MTRDPEATGRDLGMYLVMALLIGAAIYGVGRLLRGDEPTRKAAANYQECILEHMPNAPDNGVMDIRKACRAQFPDSAPPKLDD